MIDNTERLTELRVAKERVWDVDRRVADALLAVELASQALNRCAPPCEAADGDLEGDYDDARAELTGAARKLRNVERIAEAHTARIAAQLAEGIRN